VPRIALQDGRAQRPLDGVIGRGHRIAEQARQPEAGAPEIERDLDAVVRDAYIRGHADGQGGTLVAIESAWAAVEHLQARASWCVWQLKQGDDSFDFQAWRERWLGEETDE
jgi:hypothetical protein